MAGALPKKDRISLDDNPFHWGLLAMAEAAGPFMSRNKLRELSHHLQLAHRSGIQAANLETFIKETRKGKRKQAQEEHMDCT